MSLMLDVMISKFLAHTFLLKIPQPPMNEGMMIKIRYKKARNVETTPKTTTSGSFVVATITL